MPTAVAHHQPPARIGTLREAEGVKCRQWPKPESDHVRGNLHAKIHEDGGEEDHERGQHLGKNPAPQFRGKQTRYVNGRGGKERRDRAQEHQRVAKQLSSGGEKRRDREAGQHSPTPGAGHKR